MKTQQPCELLLRGTSERRIVRPFIRRGVDVTIVIVELAATAGAPKPTWRPANAASSRGGWRRC